MKILITGPTGFIGKYLIERLLHEGHSLYALEKEGAIIDFLIEREIPVFFSTDDIHRLISFFNEQKFDGVIHLASLYLVEHKEQDINYLIHSNVLLGSYLLEASVKSNVKWFINTGTFWQHFNTNTYNPVNLYAATKQAFQDIAQYYIGTSSLNFVTLKLNDTFGPNDTRPKIFNLWMRYMNSAEVLEMSAGEQIIDILYIDNVIDAYMQLIHELLIDKSLALQGKSFGVTSNERMSLKQLAQLFEDVSETKLPIKWGGKPYRKREVMCPWSDFEVVPGWTPAISVRQGIELILKN